MKMNTEQYAVWEQAVKYAGEHYNDLIYFLDCLRSEERRVGKECRSRWSPYH